MRYGEPQPFVYPAIADHLYEITAGLRSRTDQPPWVWPSKSTREGGTRDERASRSVGSSGIR